MANLLTFLKKNPTKVIEMRKMLLDGDSIVIDGVEFTTEEIKNALVDQVRYRKLSDFVQTTFTEAGVTDE